MEPSTQLVSDALHINRQQFGGLLHENLCFVFCQTWPPIHFCGFHGSSPLHHTRFFICHLSRYAIAPFQLGLWLGPFPVGDVEWPLSIWGQIPFQLGIQTKLFSVGEMHRPLSGWGYGPAPFKLGIWNGPFLVGEATHLDIKSRSVRNASRSWL